MADLLTDDMDIRDTTLSMDVGGNGDYYLTLKETKRGKKVRLDTRIAMSGGNATTEVKKAIANLYKALQGEQVSSVLQANEILPLVSQQRELLFAYEKTMHELENDVSIYMRVDSYLTHYSKL